MPTSRRFSALCFILALWTSVAHGREPCPEGQRADDYPGWATVAEQARAAANRYAEARGSRATYTTANVEALYQVTGPNAGHYLVKLAGGGSHGLSFALLKPDFDFCRDPAELETGGSFAVLSAKFNGQPF